MTSDWTCPTCGNPHFSVSEECPDELAHLVARRLKRRDDALIEELISELRPDSGSRTGLEGWVRQNNRRIMHDIIDSLFGSDDREK